MRWRQPEAIVLFGLLATLGRGQYSGWEDGQVNSSMCMWEQPRAAVIHDTVYIDGGHLYWSPGMNDGSYGPPIGDDNPLSLMYSLNFNTSFSLNGSTNLTTLFQTISKAPGGSGSANNLAPNYFDGGLLANYDEFFMYGGLLQFTSAVNTYPDSDDVLGYRRYQYGAEKSFFRPGFVDERLSSNVTRYLAYGGAASVPSENMAYYFSGLMSPTAGPIFEVSGNDSINAINVSNTMITLNMAIQQQEIWSNTSLPENTKGRANPELVWVPVGAKGILVAIGGVVYPEFANASRLSPNPTASVEQSKLFMSNIDIYDIDSEKWYKQPADSAPPGMTRGCAVVAPAKDYSSFNIYWYGGYNGTDGAAPFSDEVWVLSLPSFRWVRISSGDPTHARVGHKCFMPYPDQMIVIGGYASQTGVTVNCLKGGIIQMLNLTSGTWMDGYDPNVYHDYGVPDAVRQIIGGDYSGGATVTTPVPSGWATTDLASVFQTQYPTSKITTFYPYNSANPTAGPVPTSRGGSSLPSWVAPVLGVILGLIFVTSLVVAWFLWRRRKLLTRAGNSEPGTEDSGVRILSWIRGQTNEAKAHTAPTVTTEDVPPSPRLMTEVNSPAPPPPAVLRGAQEMENTQIAELFDTSPPVELQDSALSPMEIIDKHSHFGTTGSRSVTNPSYVSGADHSSMVSRSSGVPGGRSRVSSDAHPVDFPLPGTSTTDQQPRSRIASGVSGLSERDASHLRHISEATVSSTSDGADPAITETPAAENSAATETPASPPTAEGAGEDYIAAQQQVSLGPIMAASPLRKSVFHENQDDLVDRE